VILVDDASQDDTVEIARLLNLKVIVHDKNGLWREPENVLPGRAGKRRRYCRDGASRLSIRSYADPANDRAHPTGRADCVLGSRMLQKGGASAGGMPIYKQIGNRFLTWLENLVLNQHLSEYHTGYRAYSRSCSPRFPYGQLEQFRL